jgi:hypothetical protein
LNGLELPNGSIVHVEPAGMDYKNSDNSNKKGWKEECVTDVSSRVGGGKGDVDEHGNSDVNMDGIGAIEEEDCEGDLDDFFASLE